MTRRRAIQVGVILPAMLMLTAPVVGQDSASVKPPVAKKVARVSELHGDRIEDNYFWLRDKSNPEVIQYLEAENTYTEAMMKPYRAFQETLYKEMLGRIKQTDLSVPTFDGKFYYYSCTEEGKQYPILCRKKGSEKAKEEVWLDLNEEGKGVKFISLGGSATSENGKWIAYTLDTTGFRQYQLVIKEVASGTKIAGIAERVTSLAWANDNKTLFYTTEDPVTKRSNKVFRFSLVSEGGDKILPELLYEEKDELYTVYCGKTLSKGFVLFTSSSITTSEVRYVDANKPGEALKVLQPRETGHEYYVSHRGDQFYIRTNDKGRNFRLVTAPSRNPDKGNWKEIVPHRDTVMLEAVSCYADFYTLSERENALEKLCIVDGKSGESHYIEFPEPVYGASFSGNANYKTKKLRFNYRSFITPSSVFDWDVKKRQRELLKEQPVLGGYDRTKYQSERIYATTKDGVKVPVSLVYRKDVKRDGKAPMLLTAYGAYGSSSSVGYSSGRLSLLDRGVIFAQAHIRGGGDMGKIWHEQGRMMQKKNTFTDFIACAEHLIGAQYTAADRLVIQGGSAGGLLMGAVTNMRPDLFKAVLTNVPFVDVMNTMLDASLPLTVGEYLEWGNPNEKDAYFYMKSYSPYDNIEAKNYPAILVTTSLNDSQVMYWEPAKYVAKLRATKTDNNPLLLKTNMGAGHGGASGRYDRLKEIALEYAFILSQVGITQ